MFFTQQTSVEYVESFGEIFALDSAAVSDVNLYAVVKFLVFLPAFAAFAVDVVAVMLKYCR